ncbi:MAG TPA: Tat pathway signal protein [Stellaceae bacterium]|nr:Tat pathway signal protein [Stellaceae bacterium]
MGALVLCAAEPAPISLELNRLDEHGGSCRASFVIANPGPEAYDGFKLDLVVFDKSGTIARRLAADVAPLRASKTAVKVFDIPETHCGAIGSILVNDVLDCRAGDNPAADCVGRLAVSSKLAVKLLK